MSPRNTEEEFLLCDSHKWNLIAQNLKSWHLSQPSARNSTKIIYLSDPDILSTPECAATVNSPNPTGERIDKLLNYYRSQKSIKQVLIWYLHPSSPERLHAKFLARGVGTAGRVEWMWCDLSPSSCRTPAPAVEGVGIEIQALDFSESLPSEKHQYTLSARMAGRVVGSVVLNLTPGLGGTDKKVAGLFSMSVLPMVRNRGIGTMLAGAACGLARQKGCFGLYLNATKQGKRVYEGVGFKTLGKGHIWHLDRRLCKGFYEDEPPRMEMVRFLEAVCLGEVDVLEELKDDIGVHEMQQPTRNGMTPLELAVHCGQAGSAEWLVQEGIVGDVLSFWDLGWKEMARKLVHERPEVLCMKEGRSGMTTMDVALQRDDQELAIILASVPPPRMAENTGSGIDFGAVDWEKCFDGVDRSEINLEKSEEGLRSTTETFIG